jgi:hypothetical protein
MVEIKRRLAWSDYHCNFDRSIVAAAWRERSRSDANRASRLDREASIAQLWARHARLLREAEKVKENIALMEREVG